MNEQDRLTLTLVEEGNFGAVGLERLHAGLLRCLAEFDAPPAATRPPLGRAGSARYGHGNLYTESAAKDQPMAAASTPHFANDQGLEKISVGVRELQCMGARAPHDHPHVFLDMGQDNQIVCPYCSTLFVHDATLRGDDSEPKGCLVDDA